MFLPSPYLSDGWQSLHTAMAYRSNLLVTGVYKEWQVGMFASDLDTLGAKTFFVDTFAGRSLITGFTQKPQHVYEVISGPCWLYFDLEFCRKSNPGLEPAQVIDTFY